MKHPITFNGEQVALLAGTNSLFSIVGTVAFSVPENSRLIVCAWCVSKEQQARLREAGHTLSHGICESCRTAVEQKQALALQAQAVKEAL